MLRAVSSDLALVLSTFGFMDFGELYIFTMLLLGTTIQDGGIGVRSVDLYEVHISKFANDFMYKYQISTTRLVGSTHPGIFQIWFSTRRMNVSDITSMVND